MKRVLQLEPFQEWPQLLDPHLTGLLQPLVTAFIEYLSNHASDYHQDTRIDPSSASIPLPRAICQILYVLCKVRGQKVIVRFLNNEPRFLEPMLDAFESWVRPSTGQSDPFLESPALMIWQERFVMLWWLSHLLLTPFDLAIMSSDRIVTGSGDTCVHIRYPANTPPIARRLLYVSSLYLSSASIEREASSMLLARLALRLDMTLINLQSSIISGVLSSLAGAHVAISPSHSAHALIGLLSFLARFIGSAELHVLQPLFPSIYKLVERLRSVQAPLYGAITSSPMARKLLIKVGKGIAITSIGLSSRMLYADFNLQDETIEDILEPLFTALEDKATVVRVAAGKAISQITPKLNSELAGQVISDLVADLRVDPRLWQGLDIERPNDRVGGLGASVASIEALPLSLHCGFATEDPYQWHGLVLALSQLMFRRAIPLHLIPSLLERLLLALDFQQVSPLGAPIGTNIRDAACFGLWSLARQFSSKQINRFRFGELWAGSSLQLIANCLVVVATLDPVGNIRRGASAALQELVGRHPNKIKDGLKLVQVVDYHAIALRHTAMQEIAIDAARIDEMYWNAIWTGLLSWRGIQSRFPDLLSRRQAAEAIGRLTVINGINRRQARAFINMRERLDDIPVDAFNERHGIFIALAQIMRAMPEVLLQEGAESQDLPRDLPRDATLEAWSPFSCYEKALSSPDADRTPVESSLILEGIYRLISAIAVSFSNPIMPEWFRSTLKPLPGSKSFCISVVNWGLRSGDAFTTQLAAETAANVFCFLERPEREGLASQWIVDLDHDPADPRSSQHFLGIVAVVGAVFHQLGPDSGNIIDSSDGCASPDITPTQTLIVETMLKLLTPENPIDLRCATLCRLTSGVLRYKGETIPPVKVCMLKPTVISKHGDAARTLINTLILRIFESLRDHTINEDGDVGSLVRLEAIDAAVTMLEGDTLNDFAKKSIIAEVSSLAVGRLDKVRWKAWDRIRPYLLRYGMPELG